MRLSSIRSVLLALAGLGLMACDGTGPDPAGPPASLDIVSGDLQTATAGTELPQPLVVEVTDDKGKPVEGQVVNFVVVTGGGSVFAGTALTNEDGRAQERWTLGTTARDTQKVEARAVHPATGQALVFATFRAVATPGAPASLVRVLGGTLTGAPGVALADSLAVRLTDQHGNGISGQSVAFSAAGGGSVSPATRTTDADGFARTAWTLGTALGTPQTVSATFGTLAAAPFTATMVAGGTLARTGGVTQTGTAGALLLDSLAVRFTTPTGAPIQGAVIQWAGPGVLAPATSTTDANGYARTAWRLPTAAGTYQATANLSGATEMLAFTATANAGAPAAIARVGGDAQTGAPGVALADSLAVRVTDAHGNPVPGATVAFSAGGGGSVSPATRTTGTDGIARAAWTLGTSLGAAQTASATSGTLPAAGFTATAVASGVLTRTGGAAQTGTAGAVLLDSLEVRFTTPTGAPIQGAVIQWTGPGVLAPATSTTGADGYARTAWRLPTTPGTYQATANLSGAPERFAFTATASAGAPAAIAKLSGDAQTGAPGVALADSLAVRVTDAHGNPVPGAAVTFAAAGGGSVSPGTVTTGADGIARTRWTLGTHVGLAQTVSAAVTGLPSAGFTATSTGSGVLTRVSGNAQADTIGAFLADSLVVRFTTAAGQPIQGATVQWSHTGPGGSVLPRTSITRADGTVRAQWKLASQPGTQAAVAAVAGQAGSAAFTALARPVAPHSLAVTITPLDALINTVRTVRVQAKDRYGNPTPNVTVQWAVVCGGPMSPASSQTDANGYATTQWTVNAFCAGGATPGPRGTATVAGVPSLPFGALVHVGNPASVRANPPEVTVAPGAQFTLSYRLYDAAGVYVDPASGDCHYTCYYGYTWTLRDPAVAQIAEIRDEDIPFPRVEAVGEGTTWAIVQGRAGLDSARIVVTSAGTTAAARSSIPPRAPAAAGSSTRTAPAVRPRGRND
jgi:adhesin/invasin